MSTLGFQNSTNKWIYTVWYKKKNKLQCGNVWTVTLIFFSFLKVDQNKSNKINGNIRGKKKKKKKKLPVYKISCNLKIKTKKFLSKQ